MLKSQGDYDISNELDKALKAGRMDILSNFLILMSELNLLTERIIKFRNARDWKQFHKPKDLAISLSLEASELLEHFQWKSEEEINSYIKTNKEEIADELADVLNYLLILAHDLEIDLVDAEKKKITKNENKYPTEKAKGNAKKYTELKKL